MWCQCALAVPEDAAFHDYIRGSADHDEMFDIVATQQDKLALPVQIEGIDDGKAGLTGAAGGLIRGP